MVAGVVALMGSDWLEGLSPRERRVAEVLMAHQDDLSDGFGYYCDKARFQALARALVEAGG